MALEDIVEQLAFGKTTRKEGACLGMYLSPETIYIAETRVEKGKIAVDHLVRIPVPIPESTAKGGGPSTSSLNTDFLNDNVKLGVLIRQSMSQIRWNTKDVMVTLSHHLGLLRYFSMPAIERRFWKSAVPLEAKKYIPIPFDALAHDYQVSPFPPDAANKARQGALVAVTQKRNLANVIALLEGLGLILVGMEVAPCSVLRVWESLDRNMQGRTHCQVHFDGGNIRILLADKGLPVFFRELFLGSDAALSDIRKVDLGGCVTFAQKQLAVGQLAQVRVSGTNSSLRGWQDAFSQELGVPVAAQDTAGMLGIKGGDWGGYAAIGASVRFSTPTSIMLDLGKVGKISDEEKRTATDIFIAATLLTAWFLVVGLFRQFVYTAKSRELNQYQRDPAIEQVFSGRSKEDIDEMFKEMAEQVRITAIVSSERIKVSDVMRDVVNSLPEKVWITRMALSNPMENAGAAGGRGLMLELNGHAVAATVGQEQDLALKFRDKLQSAPVIGKMLPDIQMSVSGKPVAVDTSQAMDPDQLARNLEQRTTFTVVAKARK